MSRHAHHVRNRRGQTARVARLPLEIDFHLELAFEGHNLHEAKRLQVSVGSFAWNSPKLIMPIPQREMDVNKQLVQNAGY